eukprot:TRINITY_DN15726_c0_g1_i1.p1 TRINITY_DN15726_c0_g1~~TRINITY_DN15726_c0_g1_i1.p1  ORF type:complete len:669 (-),score=81.66 TRINITY_DN15726_c0_g1_i1:29-2035(-)
MTKGLQSLRRVKISLEVAECVAYCVRCQGDAMPASLLFQAYPFLRDKLLDTRLYELVGAYPHILFIRVHDKTDFLHVVLDYVGEIVNLSNVSVGLDSALHLPSWCDVKAVVRRFTASEKELLDSICVATVKWLNGNMDQVEVGKPCELPLTYFLRDRTVKKRLASWILLNPDLSLMPNRDSHLLDVLPEQFLDWATQMLRLRELLRSRQEAICASLSADVGGAWEAQVLSSAEVVSRAALVNDGSKSDFRDCDKVSKWPECPGMEVFQLVSRCQAESENDIGCSQEKNDVALKEVLQSLLAGRRWTEIVFLGQNSQVRKLRRGRPLLELLKHLFPEGYAFEQSESGQWGMRREGPEDAFDKDVDCDAVSHVSSESAAECEEPPPIDFQFVRKPGDIENIVVVDKPAGLTTERIIQGLRTQLQLDARSVSRLDKMTSGCLIVALGHDAAHHLQAQFKSRQVDKQYVCLCQGLVPNDVGTPVHEQVDEQSSRSGSDMPTLPDWDGRLDEFLRTGNESLHEHIPFRAIQMRLRTGALQVFASTKGSEATTLVKVLRVFKRDSNSEQLTKIDGDECENHGSLEDSADYYTLVLAKPISGRKHQIRVHMHSLGFTLAADNRYSSKLSLQQQAGWCSRMFLHCLSLVVRDVGNHECVSCSPLPSDLRSVCGFGK